MPLYVRPRSRIFSGHDWVYGTEVQRVNGDFSPGDVISLRDQKNRPLGSAIYNPNSQIIARRFSRRTEKLDSEFFRRRLERAHALRERLPGIAPDLCRLVWSESDGLPGVVVDRYGDHLVVQTLTLAMDQRIDLIIEALEAKFDPKSILVRNDSSVRVAEGMTVDELKIATGKAPSEPFLAQANGVSFLIDLSQGQKTGLYLDQLANYEIVARQCIGKSVLDCFTNQGGFALAAAMAGARKVTAIDISETAISQARRNGERNGVGERIDWVVANVFNELSRRESSGEKFDLIVLDPPSFARSKKALRDAYRGYKEIHLRALKMLQPGGLLATFSCSHHMGWSEFSDVIRAAANDAKRSLRVVHSMTQRADHPCLLHLPETEYLKGFLMEVAGAF